MDSQQKDPNEKPPSETQREAAEEVPLRTIQELEMAYQQSVTYARELRDEITARKRAEEEIHRQAAWMEALAGISQALAEVGLNVQAVFETIVRYTAEVIGDVSRLTLLSSDEQWFQPMAFHHPKPEVKALMESIYPVTPISASTEWNAHILRTGQPAFIPVVSQEQFRQSIQPEYLPFFEQVGLHSILNVPLRVEGRVIGTLGLTRDQPGHSYTPDDQVLLQDLADRAALTIQNAQLFEQVQSAHERLQALSRRLLDVQEAERRYIAFDEWLNSQQQQNPDTPISPFDAWQAALQEALTIAEKWEQYAPTTQGKTVASVISMEIRARKRSP